MGIAVRGVCPLLEVFDMPTSIRFYRDVLGFEVVEAAPPGDDCVPTWTRPTHVRERGALVEKPTVRGYGMRQLSLADPDGYGLCFQWPAEAA